MKNKALLPISILAILALTGCFGLNNTNTVSGSNSDQMSSGNDTSESEDHGSAYDYNTSISVEDPTDIDVTESEAEFKLTTKDGEFTSEDNIYTILKAGTYTAKGKLEGQILIDAGDDDEVVIELSDATIIYDKDSPIKALNCDKLEISAKKETGNIIEDNREHKTVDDSSLGEGAINAKCDLKLKGAGTLVVTGNYNNGVHTTKDLTIQKETLKVTAYNNAIKGKNSVTITSGEIQAFAQTGNGIKTENTDISSKGNQRGTIAISGGSLYVDSLHDAIDASYNVEVDELDEEAPTSVSIKTGKNSSFYSSSFVADSEKGLKAQNNININKGVIVIGASDDAIHANYGDALENGETGEGNITINDGLIKIASGDDGIHADNTLTINGGKTVVTGSVEGFEGNYINITGGYSYIYGSDDGVNCARKSFTTCGLTMSGGYLDVAVTKGDTDGIDSNGYVTITGGTIITRGSPGTSTNRMSTGLDVDGTCSMTGGTLIAFNGLEKTPSYPSSVLVAKTSNATNSGGGPGGGGPGRPTLAATQSIPAGNYTLRGDGIDLSFTNDYIYATFMIYSSSMQMNSTYTLAREGTSVLSWTQSSSPTTINF